MKSTEKAATNRMPGVEQNSDARRGNGWYPAFGKRAFDLLAAALGLVALAVPLVVIAAGIRVIDGSPVIFRQVRVGRHGRTFRIRKFRTMTNRPVAGSTVTVAGDARITRLGAWLRRLKLDEVPQLWNVLVGDMSLVGPRPDVPGYMDRLSGDARRLLDLRPGITGPATLAFRHEEQLLAKAKDPVRYNDEVIFPEKVRLNLEYLDNLSLVDDLRCILDTLVPSEKLLFDPEKAEELELGKRAEGARSRMMDS